MPYRTTPFVTGEIYHVYNRGVAKNDIFGKVQEYNHFISLLNYYRFEKVPGHYSSFSRLPHSTRASIWQDLMAKKQYRVNILGYCLMPNHFHLMLRQVIDQGILKFVRQVSNSYSHYFNIGNERVGGLFQGVFKSVHVSSEEQIINLSRYIHLNPYSSRLVKNVEELTSYDYSSLKEYVLPYKVILPICETTPVMDLFSNNRDRYLQYVCDHADYQRKIEIYKHEWIDLI